MGYITILIALASYSLYFKDIFLNRTKPHAFSWFIWSVLFGIAFLAQLSGNGGPGAWITGFTAVICFIISVVASFKTQEKFKMLDWVCLALALAALILWRYCGNPSLAVLLVTIAYVIGFLPTFRKAYYKPQQETAATFGLNAIKFTIAIFALSSFSVVTWLYPAVLVFVNILFVGMLIERRNALHK